MDAPVNFFRTFDHRLNILLSKLLLLRENALKLIFKCASLQNLLHPDRIVPLGARGDDHGFDAGKLFEAVNVFQRGFGQVGEFAHAAQLSRSPILQGQGRLV